MGIQDVIRVLIPKEDHFFDYLEKQAALAYEGAQALSKLKTDPPKAVKQAVSEIEKRGDKVSHELEDALARTFVTPLDREDIHHLSTQLDDVLDRAHATASAFIMFGITTPSEPAQKLFECLEKATLLVKDVLPALRKHDFDKIREVSRAIRLVEKEGDAVYRDAMMALFSESGEGQGPYRTAVFDARTLIREKEVLEILEDAIDGCEDVAGILTNLAVKHG